MHYLQLYLQLISIRIRGQMQYRFSFFMEAVSTALISGISFLTIALVVQKFEGIGGWSLTQVAFLYGMMETSFGIMDMLFSGYDPQNFGLQVRLGSFDQVLLRPVPVWIQVFGSEFMLRRLGRILQGLAVLIFAISSLDIHWTWGKLVYLPVVLLCQVAFFGGFFMIGSAITFWTVESIEVINIFTYGGAEMNTYPMHIYDDWLRNLFTFIIPAIFLNYYPALYILDLPDPLNFPEFSYLLAPVAGLGMLMVGQLFWQFGMKHYQSTGS